MSCCIGMPPGSDIPDSRAAVRREGIVHLGRIADAMAECGIQRLTGIIYSCWPGAADGREGGTAQAW